MTAIPASWLVRAMSIREAEEELEDIRPADLWLEHWCRFLGRFGPGDELWEYRSPESEEVAPEGWDDFPDLPGPFGYARVRDGAVVDSIWGVE